MQFLYAAHIDLVGGEARSASALEVAAEAVAGWMHDRFGVEIDDWSGGELRFPRDSAARWTTAVGAAGRLTRLDVDHPDTARAPWRWHTTVWLGEDGSGPWLRTRVGVASTADGVVVDPQLVSGRPAFLPPAVARLAPWVDGHPIGRAHLVPPARADEAVDFLCSPERRLPVLVLTRPRQGEPFAPGGLLADRLIGTAHVLLPDEEAAHVLAERLGPRLAVPAGGARLYWPGFTPEAVAANHPLWPAAALARFGRQRFVSELSGKLGRVAAMSIGAPRLEVELRRELTRAASARRQRESARLRDQVLAEAIAHGQAVDRETWEAFAADYEELERRIEQLEQANLELEIRLEETEAERQRADQQARLAWAQLNQSAHPAAEPEPQAPPRTVLEAVQRAEAHCPHLVFLDEAFDSAQESRYDSPEHVHEDLLLLEEVAASWAAGTLDGDFRTAFRSRHSGFRTGISDTARREYPGDYTRRYRGREIMLGPHLRRGTGSPVQILRIYWYADSRTRRFVVGHVGRKLRDDSNG